VEPRIEYATTPDGLSLAYMQMGDGVPLVIPPPASPWSHIRRELEIPDWQHWYEHLGEFARIVRYDGRGSGSSDRDIDSLTWEDELRDLETIVDHLGLERFALLGVYFSGIAAAQYAAKYPERVSHLMLWCGFSAQAQTGDPSSEAIRRLLETDYTLFTETLCMRVFGWGSGDAAHALASMMRDAMSPELVAHHWDSNAGVDIGDQLPKIEAPTLIMHRRDFALLPMSVPRSLNAAIPNSAMKVFEGASLSPFDGDMEDSLRVMSEFLGSDWHAAGTMHPTRTTGFRTIMFTDISESTSTTQAIGDERAQDIIRTHNEIVRRALHRFDGEEVKHTGDGIMAAFTSIIGALECAIAIQRALAAHSALEVGHPPFAVRIGINAGEPVIEGGDLFGTSVQIASRICTRAEPRQILVSDVVRQLAAGKGFLFADRGDTELRGFEDPIRLFELRWNESGV
jgi:class 3 adenylate cyclase